MYKNYSNTSLYHIYTVTDFYHYTNSIPQWNIIEKLTKNAAVPISVFAMLQFYSYLTAYFKIQNCALWP